MPRRAVLGWLAGNLHRWSLKLSPMRFNRSSTMRERPPCPARILVEFFEGGSTKFPQKTCEKSPRGLASGLLGLEVFDGARLETGSGVL